MTKNETTSNYSALWYIETGLLLLLVLFMPTQAAWSIKKGHNAIYVACGDIITALVFGFWCLLTLVTRTPEGERRWRKIKMPPGVLWTFIFAGVVSGLNSPSIYKGLKEAEGGLKAMLSDERIRNALAEFAQNVLYFIVAYALLRNLAEDKPRLKIAIRWLLILATGLLILGLIDYSGLLVLMQTNGVMQSKTLFGEVWRLIARVIAAMGSPNIYGGYWTMLAPLILAVGLTSDSKQLKVWAYTMVFISTLTLLSGGALLALLIVLPLTAYHVQRQAGGKVAGALVVGLLLVSSLGMRTYRENIRDFVQMRDSDGDIKKQYIEWQADLNMLSQHFLTGIGIGNYQLNIGEFYTYLPNKEKMPFDCNNLYLVMASSLGITGLLSFLLILCHHISKAYRAFLSADKAEERVLALGAWGGLLGFSIASVFHALLVRGTGMIFIFLLAIVGTLAVAERQGETITE